MKKLISITDLSKTDILSIFSKVEEIENHPNRSQLIKGHTVANLFFENSTRTLISFELAAKNLGAQVINVDISKSSTQKGETLKDTLQTLQVMGINAFVMRHPENNSCRKTSQWLDSNTALINAGDGNNQHPTQALLDCYTILKHKDKIESLKIAIIGDIKHSRVANSLIDCLTILGTKNIHVFGPKPLLPTVSENLIICCNLKQAIQQADVIVMLRIQKERMKQHDIPELENYNIHYGMDLKKLKYSNPSCIVMHPGPINRGIEISSQLADSSHSVILDQVKNGVLIRQAVLYSLMVE